MESRGCNDTVIVGCPAFRGSPGLQRPATPRSDAHSPPTSEHGWLIVDADPYHARAFVFIEMEGVDVAPKLGVECEAEGGRRYIHVNVDVIVPAGEPLGEHIAVEYAVDDGEPVKSEWEAERVLDDVYALRPAADDGNAVIAGILGGARFIHIKVAGTSHSFDTSRWGSDADPSFQTCIRLHRSYMATREAEQGSR